MSALRLPRILAPTALILALAGCATNALRVEYAGEVARQGDAATLASNQFLDKVAATRREANLDLFAADPACVQAGARLRARPLAEAAPVGTYCVADLKTATARDMPISVRPLTDELRPTIELIDTLASYCEALAQIVEADPVDPAQQFRDALATGKAVQDLLTTLANSKAGPIPGEADPRVKALAGFIRFVGELAKEQAQVDALRQVVKTNPDGAAVVIEVLREHLKSWDNARAGDELLRTGLVARQFNRVINAEPPASPGERRSAMQAFYTRDDASEKAGQLYPRLDKLLVTLAAIDGDLRRVLRDRPDLTRAERRRVTEISRLRLVRALNSFTSIINAFRQP